MSSLLSAIDAASSALDAQRARMEIAVSNMANADSTSSPDGQPYRRRSVILESTPGTDFGSSVDGQSATGVRVAGIVEDQTPFGSRYDPGNAAANADGFVSTPNVNVQTEMVDMVSAARAYQANISAIGLIRDTVQKAIDLGKS